MSQRQECAAWVRLFYTINDTENGYHNETENGTLKEIIKENEFIGRISEVQKNSFTILYKNEELPGKLKGRFYGMEAECIPVVGDYVKFIYNRDGDNMITEVCERKGILKRPDQAKTGVEQYMAANVDYTFIVTALNQNYNYNRITRYASVALQGNSIPVVILTKVDLCTNPGRYVTEVEGISDKVRVHAVSALYEIGMEELKEYMRPDVTICLVGSSGAGKSTLLNAIAGSEVMKTSSVRESDARGRHTTTHRQLYVCDCGTTIIDMPGMREIGMADVGEGIEDTFADIAELEHMCRFSDCRHDNEPGCAVREAIANGRLTEERLRLYKSLMAENERNYAKKKQISKWIKQEKKQGKRNGISGKIYV